MSPKIIEQKNEIIDSNSIIVPNSRSLSDVLKELSSKIVDLEKTIEESKTISDKILLDKIELLASILAPISFSELKERTVFKVQGYREEVESILLKLIKQL